MYVTQTDMWLQTSHRYLLLYWIALNSQVLFIVILSTGDILLSTAIWIWAEFQFTFTLQSIQTVWYFILIKHENSKITTTTGKHSSNRQYLWSAFTVRPLLFPAALPHPWFPRLCRLSHKIVTTNLFFFLTLFFIVFPPFLVPFLPTGSRLREE